MRNRHRALPAWLGWYPFDAPRPKQVPAGRSQQTSIIGVVLGPPEPQSPDRARGPPSGAPAPAGPGCTVGQAPTVRCAPTWPAGSVLMRLRPAGGRELAGQVVVSRGLVGDRLRCSESRAGVAQSAEQPSCKRQVSGSNPLTGSQVDAP